MKVMPKVGDIVRFVAGGVHIDDAGPSDKVHVGYVTTVDKLTGSLRVCTKPGTYYWVDRALAGAV